MTDLIFFAAVWIVACAVIFYATVRAVRAMCASIDDTDEASS